MKKYIPLLIGLACATSPLTAQQGQLLELPPAVSVRDIFNDPAWARAFAYSLTPVAEVEPKISQTEGEVFRRAQPFMAAENYAEAIRVFTTEVENSPTPSAAMVFTIAALNHRLSVLENTPPAQAEQYVQRAITNYQRATRLFE